MTCEVYPLESLGTYKYVVILSRCQGRLMLSRHRQRTTWETQGGHIEQGETPLEAARRELWEESGAEEFELHPLCDYYAADETSHANGMAFWAEILRLGEMPQNEMAQTGLFDALPENLTYPAITPKLYAYWEKELRHA